MYRTEINGKKVVYTNERIVYGNLDIFYKDVSNIQHLGDRCAFKFTYKGEEIEMPYNKGEYDAIIPYYRIAAAMTPEEDPIEREDATTGDTGAGNAGYSSSYNGNSQYNSTEHTYNNGGGFSNYDNGYRSFEKNVFTWVFCFLLGGLGVDRFVRGQVGLGICKLLLGWATLGVWALVDWIIAMVKAYGAAFGKETDFVFDERGHYIR